MSGMNVAKVYCDGSISRVVMIDPFRSELSEEYTARLMVVIPDYDLGMIEQTRSGILTSRGTPNSTGVESLAIHKAMEFCTDHNIGEFIIYSDSQAAVANVNDPRVCWVPREETYLPNTYFDRILRRTGYLRESEERVKKRKPAAPHQLEVFELFQAERREFLLSESPLWAKIRKDEKHSRKVQS